MDVQINFFFSVAKFICLVAKSKFYSFTNISFDFFLSFGNTLLVCGSENYWVPSVSTESIYIISGGSAPDISVISSKPDVRAIISQWQNTLKKCNPPC